MFQEPVFVPGVWGPYRDVLFPDQWLAEGGQSCTGELLHHVITTHPAYTEVRKLALTAQISVFEGLNDHLEKMAAELEALSIAHLARHFFFYGDLPDNRSPIADPRMKGTIIDLDMNSGADDLAIKYYAAVEFIALQTRHLIDSLNKAGHAVRQIYLSGWQCRNGLPTQTMATATGLPVVILHYIDAAAVLGSAMMGACAASGGALNLWEIMRR
jgi:FGGY-family pentulose kinase